MKQHYTYQRFLLDCPYSELPLSEIISPLPKEVLDYTVGHCLFDLLETQCTRSVSLSELDNTIDSDKDLNDFLSRISHVDCLYVVDDRPRLNNPIVVNYHLATIRAFVWHIRNCGKNCFICNSWILQ